MLVDAQGACEVEPAAELVVPDIVWRYGCISIQEGVYVAPDFSRRVSAALLATLSIGRRNGFSGSG